MKKITVLIFVDSFKAGGSERQAVELIKQLDRSRFNVEVVCFQKEGLLLTELPGNLPYIESFPLISFTNVRTFKQAVRFLKRLWRTKADIVQCFDFYSNIFAIPLARLARVPVVGSRRNEAIMRTSAQQLIERMCFRLATAVVANAHAIKDELVARERLPESKVRVIYNGLDVSRFHANDQQQVVKSGPVRVGVLANLRPEKGHLVFVEAARLLVDRGLYVKFVIGGDGDMRRAIHDKVHELLLSDSVHMVGAVSDVPAFLRSLDVVVLPSLNESFPNAAMEAMAAGKPVVATDTGGVAELVIDGLTGYLVPPRDSAALAERLACLCEEPELRRKMGEAGYRRVVERFSSERMARDFERLYGNLLHEAERTTVA